MESQLTCLPADDSHEILGLVWVSTEATQFENICCNFMAPYLQDGLLGRCRPSVNKQKEHPCNPKFD